MQGANAVLNVLTIPPGASITSPRIVLDGVRGAVFVYTSGGPSGSLIGSWAGQAGTDPYGNPYPAGLNVGSNSNVPFPEVFVQATAPSGTIQTNSIWFNTTSGTIETWNGSAWVTGTLNASNMITAGTIVTNLLVANFFSGYEIDGAIFRAKNSSGATIMTINKAAGAWILYVDLGSATQGPMAASGNNSLSSVTDEFGNTALPGLSSYGGSTGAWTAINVTGAPSAASVGFYMSSSSTQVGFTSQGSMNFVIGSAMGISNSGFGWAFASGETVQVNASVQFVAQTTPPSLAGFCDLSADSTATALVIVNGAGQGLFVDNGTSDHTSRTVTGTSQAIITGQFTIPANDLKVGTRYRLTAFGQGTQAATTAVQLNFFPVLGGTTFCNTDFQGGSNGAVAAGTAFHWYMQIEIICTATGTGGAITAGSIMSYGASTAAAPGNQCTAPGNAQSFTLNTTVSNTLQVNASWASTTGSPTITGFASTFDRSGP